MPNQELQLRILNLFFGIIILILSILPILFAIDATTELLAMFVPATSGTIVCDTKVIHKGKKIAVMESEIKNNEKLVAKALGTYSIFKIS